MKFHVIFRIFKHCGLCKYNTYDVHKIEFYFSSASNTNHTQVVYSMLRFRLRMCVLKTESTSNSCDSGNRIELLRL